MLKSDNYKSLFFTSAIFNIFFDRFQSMKHSSQVETLCSDRHSIDQQKLATDEIMHTLAYIYAENVYFLNIKSTRSLLL